MYSTVADVMSTDLVVATRSTPCKELIRRMRERRVNALPVVDPEHRPIDIVTRRDLLGVFLTPDEEIRATIRRRVLGTLDVAEGDVDVQVHEGVVTLAGKVQWRSLAREIVRLTSAVEGVVGVVDRLGYRRDDTAPTSPSRRPS